MIDIHSHILYGIDDGASTLEESLSMLKKMKELGFTKVIATPHYIENTEYTINNKTKKAILEEIKTALAKENIPIEIYLGNEIFIDDDLLDKMLNQEIYSLNNTNYVLIELPRFEKIDYALDILYELIRKGVKVILAHPERYMIFQKDTKLIDKYLELGLLLQGNIDSLEGKYGKEAKKLFIKLLKEKKYCVLASDVHHANSSFFQNFENIMKKLTKYTDKDYLNDLLVRNAESILNNENI